MVGCGNKSKNNSATSPSSGNGATDMPNETELPESTNNAADDAGNAVDDAVDGAGNAVKDATDGVEDAVDDHDADKENEEGYDHDSHNFLGIHHQ